LVSLLCAKRSKSLLAVVSEGRCGEVAFPLRWVPEARRAADREETSSLYEL
jgi:hypothetical protein